LTLTIDEMDRIARLGGFAANLLVDETFRDIVRGLKEDAMRQWVEAQHPDEREALWRDIQAVGRLENTLHTLKQNYHVELAKQEAEKQKQVRQRYQEIARG
jgi:hypothetical protein